jgi:hypothetical protein
MRATRMGLIGLAVATSVVPRLAAAATLTEMLRDGWDVKAYANSTNAQILLQKADRIVVCTLNIGSVLDCVDISNWRVNGPK